MRAGSLEFVLSADPRPLLSATTQSQTAVKSLTSGTATGMQQLSSSAKLATHSLRSLGGVMSVVGQSVAPQLTGSIQAITNSYFALSSASKAAGVGLAGGSLIAVGVVAAFATLSAAADHLKASYNELQSIKGAMGTFGNLDAKLRPMLRKAIDAGELGRELGEGLIQGLNNAKNLEEWYKAIRKAQTELRKGSFTSSEDFDKFNKELSLRTLTGKDRAIAEAEMQRGEDFERAMKSIKGSGVPDAAKRSMFEKIEQSHKMRLAEIEKEFASPEAPGQQSQERPSRRLFGPQNVTDLERIGLVFNGASNRPIDYTSRTADNTSRMLDEQKTTNKLLREKPTNSDNYKNI